MNDAPSESRNTTSGATSSTVPVRSSGVCAMLASRKVSGAEVVIGVSIWPGWMVLTRIPRAPSSTQAALDSPRSAHLLAV
ncbi:hypothetical protein JOF55_004204 [Haloactinomyces albus]|uniref:Uncharacterized protein n=1 Tax=Haloactinomyces albus TaxID=1352928 RepID=A0AAE3ZFJ4_9ACTN|nr:hypothetical protein [Haloactinomyces albus]MDR7304023.1 hypothetical protein [Haloactinomyces albus]